MKVVCSNCNNSWELAPDEVPAGTGDFETKCTKCGSQVSVSREESGSSEGAQWFVAFGRERKGPFDEATVKKMIVDAEIQPAGFIWRQGFDNWKKAIEVPEFTSSFPQAGQGSDSGMVWQRRETSVLFSLDDYKQRKATRSQGAVRDDVVSVKPLDEEPGALVSDSGTPGAGMISFDEAEVQRVADALARRKKTKRGLLTAVIVLGALLLVAAGGLVAMKFLAPDPTTILQQQVQAPAPTPTPAPVAVNDPVPEPDKGTAVEKKPENVDEAGEPTEKDDASKSVKDEDKAASSETEKAEPEKSPARSKGRQARAEKAQKPSKSAKTEKVDKAPEKKAPEKKAEKPAEKAKPATGSGNDASSLLAQLHKGKSADSEGKKDKKDSDSGSSLPERLTVSQVSRGFGSKKAAMEACVKEAGEPLPFKAQARVEIEGSGRVVSAKLIGGGNARACLEGVLRSVRFDRFGGDNMKVPYTVSVR